MENPKNPFIETLASANGIDESNAMALMATIINGVTGPRNSLYEHAGNSLVPPMQTVLVDDTGVGTNFIERLLYSARGIQTAFENRFLRIDRKVLQEFLAGEKSTISHERNYSETCSALGVSRENADGGPMRGFPGTAPPAEDFRDRLDSVVRPSFLVESPSMGTLSSDVGYLNMASGLVWGGAGLTAEDLTKESAAKFLGTVKSQRIPIPQILCGGAKGLTQPTHISWLLKSRVSSLARPELGNLFRDSLVLDAKSAPLGAIPEGSAAQRAGELWKRAVEVAHLSRRSGDYFQHLIPEESGRIEFDERYREYLRSCHEAGVVSQTVIQLPRLILCVPIMEAGFERTHLSVEEYFRHAETLCRRHQRLWHGAKVRERNDYTIGLAERLMERIRERQPVSQRDLIRSFNDQRKATYLPTIDLMLRAGLIVEPSSKVYRTGSVGEVEAALRPLLENQHLKIAV